MSRSSKFKSHIALGRALLPTLFTRPTVRFVLSLNNVTDEYWLRLFWCRSIVSCDATARLFEWSFFELSIFTTDRFLRDLRWFSILNNKIQQIQLHILFIIVANTRLSFLCFSNLVYEKKLVHRWDKKIMVLSLPCPVVTF